MIRIEDADLERAVLAGEMGIAIPAEIYLPVDGEPKITTFALCEEPVREYASRFAGELLSDAALAWLGARIGPQMAIYGYAFDREPSGVIEEYLAEKQTRLPTENKALRLDLAGNQGICENETSVEIEPESAEQNAVFAVVENGRIVSLACVNDAEYSSGAVELYVETAPKHRNKGYGKMCVAALANHFLQQEKTVWYKCYAENSASVAIARSCGFHLVGKRAAMVCYADV